LRTTRADRIKTEALHLRRVRHGLAFAVITSLLDPSTELIFNGEPIVGWDAIYAKQREWWQNGKTDVVYVPRGRPDVRLLSPDLAVTTLLMKSTRTMPDGSIKEGNFAVSAIWKKRPEGWRILYAHESTTH
jgi:ketosteroid isomerase-like protein